MEGGGIDACLVQLVGQHFGGVALGHKDQGAFPFGLAFTVFDQLSQQLGAACAVHTNGTLADVFGAGRVFGCRICIDLHTHGVLQQLAGQCFHVLREGGREQQGLALGGQQGQHAVEFFGKALVQQAVGFVQHQMLHMAQSHGVVVHQVQQAAGRSHQKVCAAAQLHHLRVDGDTAVHDAAAGLVVQLAGEVAQAFMHLLGQLACGHQNQGGKRAHKTGVAALLCHPLLQQRHEISHGLARARGGAGPEVTPGQCGGNGLGLDGRGVVQAQVQGSIQKLGAQA